MLFRKMFLPQFAADGGADGAGGAGGSDGGAGAAGAGDGAGAAGAGAGGEGKPSSFDEILKIKENQSEFDKRIQKSLETNQAKWEAEYKAKLDEAKTEAQKLAKMNADEKATFERQKQEETLAKREAGITQRELKATAIETLVTKGLPRELADILNYTDAKTCSESIDSVTKAFGEAVTKAVDDKLRQPAPGGAGAIDKNDPFLVGFNAK